MLGGTMGAYDAGHYPWLLPTQRLIAEAVVQETPFLGLCLGHQLAAVALGGSVTLRPQGPSRGLVPMTGTEQLADDPLFRGMPRQGPTVAFNADVVDTLPRGAVVLGRDPFGHPHLVRYAPRAWGAQFHPEVTSAMFAAWARMKAVSEAEAEEAAAMITEVSTALPRIDTLWQTTMRSFFRQVRGPGHEHGGHGDRGET
ncbi:hypothetical protein KILIM_031_00220 [Kineosphaera limosa NBRC 100340]|uniref:Glutamine amidotransferase domain-containing protein n=1 Tax=Kineosphaera limosa NBRC 100340 TaxID=1184609 RepID=K6WA18_9MICO|nr:hypothetical protein KILIM_031_00220 [Kineosphaera limosa NBRC 100340]